MLPMHLPTHGNIYTSDILDDIRGTGGNKLFKHILYYFSDIDFFPATFSQDLVSTMNDA